MRRVAYVYANPRRDVAAAVVAGRAPDTGLLGMNHLAALGFDATIHDSRVRNRTHVSGFVHQVTWLTRELTIPWEIGRGTTVVSPLGTLLPLATKLRRSIRLVLLNINLCTALQRLDGARRALLVTSLRAADAIVCLAEAQRAKLLEQVSLDPSRVHLVHLGVDGVFYTPVADPEKPHVVAVGRDLGRDYATLAAAVRGLGTPTTIVASERNLIGIDLPDNVTVEIDVSPLRLRELYASATCVVVPTKSQEFGQGADCSGQTVLLDAMAMGRPVAISRRSTLDDYIDDGEAALKVAPEDAPALRSAITRLLEDADLRARLGASGRQRLEERFTTAAFAAGLAPILRSLE